MTDADRCETARVILIISGTPHLPWMSMCVWKVGTRAVSRDQTVDPEVVKFLSWRGNSQRLVRFYNFLGAPQRVTRRIEATLKGS